MYPSSAQPSNYVARKLTRHYYYEVARFLERLAPRQIESFRQEVDTAFIPFRKEGHPGKPAWANGDFYFAAIVPEGMMIQPEHIAIGAFLDFGPRGRRLAKVRHIAMNEELLNDNPRLLNGFFQLVHRSASARSRTEIVLTTALDTCLPRFLTRNGYQIIRNEFRGDANRLNVTFRTDILPAYTGDTQRWTPLCRWYLGLSFGQYLPVGGLEESATEQKTHSIPIDISPLCRADGSRPSPAVTAVAPLLQTVPVNAVVIPTTDLLQPEKLADELDAHLLPRKYNLAFLNCRRATAPQLRPSKHQCTTVYRDEIEQLLKDVKGMYFSKPSAARDKQRWNQLLRLKLGFNHDDRSGVVIEIDRDSYSAMLRKLKAEPGLERLLFFNDGGFGETLDAGTTVFFYVWDSPATAQAAEVPGVIAGYGRVAEVKSWTFKQLDTGWQDLSRYTIWKEAFAEQYFSEPVVGFSIEDVACVDEHPDDGGGRCSLDGVAYEAMLSHLFGATAGTPEQLKAAEELLPTWDVKNVYLDEYTSSQLIEDLRKNARGKLRHFIAKPVNRESNEVHTDVSRPLEPTLAGYWVNRTITRSEEPPPDVFFSFAGADEIGVGWKSHIMDTFAGELEAAGFQAPYVFDETRKREALGKLWAESLVERMSCCRTALILWSPSYMSSPTCFQLELPYLLWRWKNGNLPVYFLRLKDTIRSRFQWPGIDLGGQEFDINAVNDDRVAVEKLTALPGNLRNATLQGLRDQGQLDLLNQRLTGTLERILSDLEKIREAERNPDKR